MRKSIFIGALALPLLGASCFNLQGSITNQIAEQATETVLEGATGSQNIEIDGDQVSIVGEDGQTINIGSEKLPEDFPGQVPLYSGATVSSSFSSGNESEGVWTVTFTSADEVETVNAFFKDELAKNGWETTYSYSLDESFGYTAKKDDLSVTVTVSSGDDNGTSIFISVNRESAEAAE